MPEAAAPSHINGDPFKWEPQPVAPYDFEMQDGIFRVYDSAAHTSELFPVPGNSFDFFSDMSRCVCMYACMHVCMYVYMYVCMYVCMYAC